MFQPNGAPSTDGEILTVMDVAQFLRVPKSTVYKLARVGELPASKIGKHWRFLRRDIHEWLRRLPLDSGGWTPVHVEMGIGFGAGDDDRELELEAGGSGWATRRRELEAMC